MRQPKKKTVPKQAKTSEVTSTERINRYMARCGLCSRREADRWIESGRVELNGEKVLQPGIKIKPEDRLVVDGHEVKPSSKQQYYIYYKPRGLLCSRRDDRDRPLIYEKLDVDANVQSVGRLDMDSEGLLLLTDDGAMTRSLTQPGARLARKYRVRIVGRPTVETLEILRRGGIDIGRDERSDPWEVIVDAERSHSWLTVTIHRGRWREVRRTLEVVGHDVRRLIRTAFGSITLDESMRSGLYRPLTASELRKLRTAQHKCDQAAQKTRKERDIDEK
ncbi:MAG: pseudouridine synthase [Mariprofundaceae bacterium]